MKLRQFYIKVGLFGLLLLFCILFGVSLASSGMERIQGAEPASKAPQESVKPAGKTTTSAAGAAAPARTASSQPGKEEAAAKSKATPKPDAAKTAEPVADHDDSLNHVGNKLGDLLQIASHHGIKLFVSLFDAVLGKG
ncbi:DUF3679 domain-containing protein [Paenibacillus sp. GCM10023248]|uniref:DUF3679 domain-containing protein n=1 Tax=Bacillales TaxID=1385 RepID=UPI0023790D7A|nr:MULTISPECIES: DUF3679 domain-containing protein [Bacillales]MDD9268710.1 DUF3679 domain-containing protein [Paenibacillus sp. MAHUQ-63]MDR6880057.1 putative lipid-binding transport protein (Tim44 family) [Bacillus sp. 3255]